MNLGDELLVFPSSIKVSDDIEDKEMLLKKRRSRVIGLPRGCLEKRADGRSACALVTREGPVGVLELPPRSARKYTQKHSIYIIMFLGEKDFLSLKKGR